MAETYLITAKTVEEAVSVAKREYEDARHEVSYEIVEMPKKGFLGLGAKPAKIKVTVSKVMTVQSELGSLVADIKNMKNLTDREGTDHADRRDHAERKENREPKADAENGRQQKNQPQNQPKQQKQNGERQNQPKQNQGKQPQNQQKQNQPQKDQQPAKQNQPKQNQPAQQNQNQPKQNQNQNAQKQQNQPKQNQPAKDQQPKKQQPAAKAEKAEAKAETKPVEVVEAPVEAPVAPEQPKEKEAAFGESTGYRSALGNQAKPQRRNRQRRSAKPAEESAVEATGVTVSAPVGLTDFVSEPAQGAFGQDDRSSGSRMNNDVRRKNRQQNQQKDKEKEKTPAPEAAAPVQQETEAPQSRRQRNRRPVNIQKAVNEDLASRYDIAETDEDYEKLDRLSAESETAAPAEIPAKEAAPAEDRRREAITREEMDYALDFANTLLKNMQLDARAVPAECPEGEEFVVTETADVYPKIDIIGSETGILIGHHGETLDSIQYLVNLSALRKTKSRDGDYVKIVVDIENYREKREETLRTLARRMAARAVRYRRNVFLEPMNAYERRIIHSELQSFENVSTHSVGADRDRKIIITYEGPEKAPASNAGEGRRRRRGESEEQDPAQTSEKESGGRRRRGSSAETAEASEKRERERRPRKPNKMPIEQLTDWLPDAGTPETESETADGDDVLHVMSGLRETFREAVEEIDEVMAEPETEEPLEEPAEEPFEEPVEEAVEEPLEEPLDEPAEEPAEEPVEEPIEEPVEEAAAIAEEAVEAVEEDVSDASDAAEETVEEAAETFEEKAQALTDILEAIADNPSSEEPVSEAEKTDE